MGDATATRTSIARLILVPAAITLAVTLLRLVGELQHWSPLFFNASAGGGLAIVGISWLPLVFGPYFALKLSGAGEGPGSSGKAIGYAVLGVAVFVGGGFLGFGMQPVTPTKILIGLALMAAGAAVTLPGWSQLGKALLAYGYAARIPVTLLMFFAIRGSWGTHYDALPPNYTGPKELLGKFLMIGFVPQMVLWVAYTIVAGALFGTIVAAIARRGKPATSAQAAS